MSFTQQLQQIPETNNNNEPKDIFPQIVDVRQDSDTKETFVKAFLISDKLNAMNWQIPESGLKKYVTSFIGKPLIAHPSGLHPDYLKEGVMNSSTFLQDILNHQKQYALGDIIDTQYEKIKSAGKDGKETNDSAYFAYIKLYPDKASIINNLKSAAGRDKNTPLYVSPQIYDLDGAQEGEKTYNYYPLHLAIVNQPAYGSHAQVRGMCNGSSNKCMQELKSAAYIFKTDNSSLENSNQNNDHNPMPQNSHDQLQANLATTGLNPNNNNTVGGQQQQQLPNQNTGGVINNNNPNTIDVNSIPSNNNNQQGILSETKQVKKISPDGKLVIENQISKPNPNLQQQQQQPNQNLQQQVNNPNNIVDPNVNVDPNLQQQQQIADPNAQFPFDFSKLPKEIKDVFTTVIPNLQKEIDDLKSYKQSQEETKIKAAAEQQRQTIEAALSAITDPTVRQGLVDFFIGLNVQDDQLQKLLELYTTGVFQPNQQNQQQDPNQQQQQSGLTSTGKVSGFPKKPGIKNAAVTPGINAIMTNIDNNTINAHYKRAYRTGVFGNDVDFGNILS